MSRGSLFISSVLLMCIRFYFFCFAHVHPVLFRLSSQGFVGDTPHYIFLWLLKHLLCSFPMCRHLPMIVHYYLHEVFFEYVVFEPVSSWQTLLTPPRSTSTLNFRMPSGHHRQGVRPIISSIHWQGRNREFGNRRICSILIAFFVCASNVLV